MRKRIDLIAFITLIIFTASMFYIVPFSSLPYKNHWSYFVICINMLFAIIFFRKRTWLITLGLFFTLISDYFLAFKVYTYVDQCIAMTTFSMAQISYGVYIILRSENPFKKISIIIRIVLSIVGALLPVILLPVMGNTPDYLSVATCIYGVNLLLNFVFSCINFKKVPLLVFGFLFFMLCDITVLLSAGNGNYFNIPTDSFIYKILNQAFNLTWAFYIPSQMLIVLSEIPSISNLFKIEKIEKNR